MEAENVTEPSSGIWGMILEIWNTGILGIDLGRIIVAAVILLGFLALRKVLSTWMRQKVEALTARSASKLDDKIGEALQEPLYFVPVVLGVFFSTQYLGLYGLAADLSDSLSKSLIAFTLFWMLVRLVDPLSLLAEGLERHIGKELIAWFLRAIRIALWLIGGATILEIWGIRVAPIIAGFGLLGVAVALGAQDLFKNLISGILILAEKRFRVGDWVKIDGVVEGTVEQINFRSTKVRRFDKAPVYIPNTAFADGAVTNFGEMTHRRIYWTIGLEYRTTAAQLSAIRAAIEAYILADERYLRPEEAATFVRIDGFNDSSIDLMLYCFTRTRDWGEWLAIKEELLIAIKRIVEEAGSGFAFPSQSVYVEAMPEPPKPARAGSRAVAKTSASKTSASNGKPRTSKAASGGEVIASSSATEASKVMNAEHASSLKKASKPASTRSASSRATPAKSVEPTEATNAETNAGTSAQTKTGAKARAKTGAKRAVARSSTAKARSAKTATGATSNDASTRS
ncbi:MAG: mechanosensitive ion channel [Neomegalonema sp.]|nr:mechanosensitive ion channel [Neomegalonema sp.]